MNGFDILYWKSKKAISIIVIIRSGNTNKIPGIDTQ